MGLKVGQATDLLTIMLQVRLSVGAAYSLGLSRSVMTYGQHRQIYLLVFLFLARVKRRNLLNARSRVVSTGFSCRSNKEKRKKETFVYDELNLNVC